jgi:electron transfer flavoprotein alpha subunit
VNASPRHAPWSVPTCAHSPRAQRCHDHDLVIAEHDHGILKGATLNTVTAAIDIARLAGGEVHVLVAGHNANGAATDAAAARRAWPRCCMPTAPQLAEQLGENIAAQVMAVAMDYSHLLFPADGPRQERRAPRGRPARRGPDQRRDHG